MMNTALNTAFQTPELLERGAPPRARIVSRAASRAPGTASRFAPLGHFEAERHAANDARREAELDALSPKALFPTYESVDIATARLLESVDASLDIDRNAVYALLMSYHNTLLAQMGRAYGLPHAH